MPCRVRLSGAWQVHPIPLDADLTPDAVSFADSITVPECAHLQPVFYPDQPYFGADLRRLNEQAWLYRRTFTTPETAYRRARLLFEGVDYFASVWLNGGFVGEHEGHFAPFAFDMTHLLRRDIENTLLVRVCAPWDRPNPRGTYPIDHVIRGLIKGQYEHGEGVIPPDLNPLGIWRPVWLALDDGLSLDRVQIRTELDGTINLRLSATNVTGQAWQGMLSLEVAAENHDGSGVSTTTEATIPVGVNDIVRTLHVADPRLWWPWDHGRPDLYRLAACLHDGEGKVVSTLTDTFGIRDIVLDRSPERFVYRINGRPVFVRGSSYMPGLYLSEQNRSTLSRDLTLARDANLNLLRVHVHVSPPDLYDLCDRAGILLWQDFELNWVHDPSPEFEGRARALQHDMIDLLGNHPSIITWACHNEPTMLFVRRQNLERHPDPALYQDAIRQDSTRPVFLCSGQMERDWQRSGDMHSYYGALWSARYTDAYRHRFRLNTEFGFEAPAARSTLQACPEVWRRLDHLDDHLIAELGAYQAQLIQFQVEHFRRQRAECSAGYIHFWLTDLVPQVGCGVLDANRKPKPGYEALRQASQPLHVALEHDGRRAYAVWIFNDTPTAYPGAVVRWTVRDADGQISDEGQQPFDVAANGSQRVIAAAWSPPESISIDLALVDQDGGVLAANYYPHPFQPSRRPKGYPWKFDPTLGTKVFDRPGAPSLADVGASRFLRLIPLSVREQVAEWVLRQKLPPRLLSIIAQIGAYVVE